MIRNEFELLEAIDTTGLEEGILLKLADGGGAESTASRRDYIFRA
jgi:hypothetical protein